MKVAILPSNQLNSFAGMPGIYEKDWAKKVATPSKEEFEKQGHVARIFYVEPQGAKSTDELGEMIAQALAWKPDMILSIHSDWASPPTDVFPQIGSESDRAWGTKSGKLLAERLGMSFQPCAIRIKDLMFFYQTVQWASVSSHKRILQEIGRFNTQKDANFAWTYATYEGIMLTRTTLLGAGVTLVSDGPVPKGVMVPPGQEKYAYVEKPKFMPDLVITWQQKWRLVKYTSDPMTSYLRDNPIWYLEWKLRKRHPENVWGAYRGIYDPTLEQDVRVFQKEVNLPVTGEMHKADWAALMAPGAP